MQLIDVIRRTENLMRRNSPTILTALGVSGVIGTAYLTAKASFVMANEISAHDDKFAPGFNYTTKEKVKAFWQLYIPAAVSGSVTIACIIGATKVGSKRTAAAYSLLTVSEKAFVEYKDKVVEQIGAKKEQALRDEIAQDRVTKNPQGLVVVGAGNILCYEMHTGRYFNSDMETIRKAQNEINAKMLRETEASLSDFYYLVGLPPTSYSDRTGWQSTKLLELSFSTVMSEDNRPCISFEYNYIEPF